MTVIAYKSGRMACDALCVDLRTGATVSRGNKIHRTKAGALIGQSGDADSRAFLALMENVRTGDKIPASKALAECRCSGHYLCVFKNGHIWEVVIYENPDMEEWGAQAIPITGMGAIGHAGCGGELAMAFMRSGKSARAAVAAVCEINAYCAPPIYEELLHPPARAPGRGTRKPARRKGR